MEKYKIYLETNKDILEFIEKADDFAEDMICVQDNQGHCASAHSLLGMLYAFEWKEIYLVSRINDPKIYSTFKDFII